MTEFKNLMPGLTPAAYYRFTAGAETTDTSTNTNTLTAIGVPVQGTPKWGNGCVGYGTSQAHSAVDGADFKPAGNFSVSIWVRTSKTGVVQSIAQSYSQNTAYAGFRIYIQANNTIRIESGKNTGTTGGVDRQSHDSVATVTDGAWHHCVGTYDGAKLHVYIDGTEDGTGTAWTNAAVFAATNYVRVGCQNNTGTNANYVQGLLDEVSFFPSDALTSGEVTTLYNNSISSSACSAILAKASAVYLFEDGAQLVDSKGANTLTAIGTPTTVTTQYTGSTFLGNSSAYSAVDSASLKPTTAFTIGCWFKYATSGAAYLFQSQSANTAIAGFWIQVQANNSILFGSGKNTGTVSNTDFKQMAGNTTTLNDGKWHQTICTWDGALMSIFVDGRSNATPVAWANAPVYAGTNYPRVGCRNPNGTNNTHFPGQIDDVFLLNGTALNAQQIYQMYSYAQPAHSQNNLSSLCNINSL